jgi:hypothetical protein
LAIDDWFVGLVILRAGTVSQVEYRGIEHMSAAADETPTQDDELPHQEP